MISTHSRSSKLCRRTSSCQAALAPTSPPSSCEKFRHISAMLSTKLRETSPTARMSATLFST